MTNLCEIANWFYDGALLNKEDLLASLGAVFGPPLKRTTLSRSFVETWV